MYDGYGYEDRNIDVACGYTSIILLCVCYWICPACPTFNLFKSILRVFEPVPGFSLMSVYLVGQLFHHAML